MHYFYHPAKNRLVEVVAGGRTDPAISPRLAPAGDAGQDPDRARSDAYGFIVNRFFLPWLTEAVRMLEEGVADVATIDEAAKKAFGIGMGPFELMNVTGVPIALHAGDDARAGVRPDATSRRRCCDTRWTSGSRGSSPGRPTGEVRRVAERLAWP